MAALKCIGGVNDGEIYEVKTLKVGDIFNIQEKIATPLQPELNETVKPTTFKINQYKLSYFRFGERDLYWFMHPVDWTHKQAVEWQFGK